MSIIIDEDRELLASVQRDSFNFFIHQMNETTGLIADSTAEGSPGSIASVGMALTSYIVAAKNGFLQRSEIVQRALKVLRFLNSSHQGPEPDASGYKGFYYHFLDMQTGRRTWQSELSTIDTAFLMAGCLTLAHYLDGSTAEEEEARQIVDALYRRVDWAWMLNGEKTLVHGWMPEKGFLPDRWEREYSEATLLYVLAMGSPTHAIGPEGYEQWIETFEFKKFSNLEYIFAGPLFIHQFSPMWIDFRGIRDHANEKYNLDYFENSRRATLAQQAYAIFNPLGFKSYGEFCWGFTASEGPGEKEIEIDGHKKRFYAYVPRGAPDWLDDGTVSPWAAISSLPFAPEIVTPTVRNFAERLKNRNRPIDGLEASFNFTYPHPTPGRKVWVSPWLLGLNQGPIVCMIEKSFFRVGMGRISPMSLLDHRS